MLPNRSLLEYKLRRYVYLGHHKNIYVPLSFRKSFWKNEKYLEDITGIQLIAKVVQKNDINEINSIVPILLMIKHEDNIIEDQHLIFALAVCARFHVKNCIQMNADAYAAVQFICKDGLQILKFAYMVKKASFFIHKQGYVKSNCIGYGEGFRNAIRRWYLSNDPFQVTKQIVMNKNYYGTNHRDLMNICHLTSSDPCRQIFIVNTCFGIGKVRSDFTPMLYGGSNETSTQYNSRLQLQFIYNYLQKMYDMNKNMSIKEMFSMTWEKDFLYIPQKCLKSFDGLTFFVNHCPLKILLNNTHSLSNKHYFYNVQYNAGCWRFIARFNETKSLKNSGIHPIESYLEYIRYRYNGFYEKDIKDKKKKKNSPGTLLFNAWKLRLGLTEVPVVVKKPKNLQQSPKSRHYDTNFVLKHFEKTTNNKRIQFEPEYSMGFYIDDWDNSLDSTEVLAIQNNVIVKNNKIQQLNIESECSTSSSTEFCNNTSMNTSIASTKVPEVVKKSKELKTKKKSNLTNIGTNWVLEKDKPKPKKAAPLLKFLSEDLVAKSLKFLKPHSCNILIAYDGRYCTFKQLCKYMHLRFVRVCDAIILVILSIIYPLRKRTNKPLVCSLDDSKKPFSVIKVNYNFAMNFEALKKKLLKESDEYEYRYGGNNYYQNDKKINPSTTVNWAIRSGKSVDVFVFLGTNNMNIKNLKKNKKLYEEFSGKKVKIIICCLTGGHTDQLSVCNEGMLFIAGFDKNVGKIIDAFINDEF